MTAALQTELAVADEMINPLLDVRCARHELRRFRLDEDDILNAVRAGFIEWAFDISNGEMDRRIELRILPASVAHLVATGGTGKLGWTWQQVAAEILRGATRKMTLRGREVEIIDGTTAKLILNCSSTQVTSFVPHQFKLLPGTTIKSGPNGTPQILADSFTEFLRKRRIK